MLQFPPVSGMPYLVGFRGMASDGFVEVPLGVAKQQDFLHGCGCKDAQAGIPFQSKQKIPPLERDFSYQSNFNFCWFGGCD
jgi:hypothetical protein